MPSGASSRASRASLTAGLFVFGPDGRAAPYGFTVRGEPRPGLGPVPRRRTSFLRERAERGPWIASWEDRPRHPYNDVFTEAGVVAIAYAPVRHGRTLVGFVHLGIPTPDAEAVAAANLPALIEFADIAGALLGRDFADRTVRELARLRVSSTIEQAAFSPVFQPIVDIARDVVVGYEALTRFRDGTPPDVQFAEAEGAGLGIELELATLRVVLETARELPDGPWLNINVSPSLVLDHERLNEVLRIADRDLVVEVTEHEAIEDYAAFREAVDHLGPGIRIAVDDAGAGFASLRHILELRPAMVKLDRCLVAGIETDRARRALVAGMQHFAGDADIRLVAEGVETDAELATLRDLDIELSQGYLLGRPLPVDAIGSRDRSQVPAPARRVVPVVADIPSRSPSSTRRAVPVVPDIPSRVPLPTRRAVPVG